jgi:hypothetical protein
LNLVNGRNIFQGYGGIKGPGNEIDIAKIRKKASPVQRAHGVIFSCPFHGAHTTLAFDILQKRINEIPAFSGGKIGQGDMIHPGPLFLRAAEMHVINKIDQTFDPTLFFIDKSLGNTRIIQFLFEILPVPHQSKPDFISVSIEKRETGIQVIGSVFPDFAPEF